MSTRPHDGPHLVLRFRDHNERGRQEVSAVAFRCERAALQMLNEWGDWQPFARFDYNQRRWLRAAGGVLSELRLDHSEEQGKLGIEFYWAEGKSRNVEERTGTILFERPRCNRSVLTVKLRERYVFDGAGRPWKTKLAYQELDTFNWRSLTGHPLGTLVIRTPGRKLVPPPLKFTPIRASRPTGLTLGLNRAA